MQNVSSPHAFFRCRQGLLKNSAILLEYTRHGFHLGVNLLVHLVLAFCSSASIWLWISSASACSFLHKQRPVPRQRALSTMYSHCSFVSRRYFTGIPLSLPAVSGRTSFVSSLFLQHASSVSSVFSRQDSSVSSVFRRRGFLGLFFSFLRLSSVSCVSFFAFTCASNTRPLMLS